MRSPFRSAISVLAAAAFGVGFTHAQEPTRADADAMQAKLERIDAAAETPRRANARPRRTTFTEREINAYLVLDGPTFLPPGIAMPEIRLGDDGRVRARATVDLDAVRRARDRSLIDPLRYMRGRLEVVAAGSIEGEDGQGLIRYESATVGGVTVPKTVAQELLRFYTRSEKRPRGFAFDEPFELPVRMRAVSVKRGSVAVTQ
jgi:hypothetical protein